MASGTRFPLGLEASLGRDSRGSADDDDLGGLGFLRLAALQGLSALIMAQMLMGNQQVGRLRVHSFKGLQQIQTPGQDCCRLV